MPLPAGITIYDLDPLPSLPSDGWMHVFYNGFDYKIQMGDLFSSSKFVFVNATPSGVAGKFVATTSPAITAYDTTVIYIVKFSEAPTPSDSLNIDGISDVLLKKYEFGNKVNIAASDFQSQVPVFMRFDEDGDFVNFFPIEHKPALPAIKNFAGCMHAVPPTENDGDIYVLSQDGEPYEVDSINWQAGTAHTVRYLLMGSFADMSTYGGVGAFAKITGCTNPKHDGLFEIVGWDNSAGWIKVINPLISNSADDESGSSGLIKVSLEEWDGATVNDWVKFDSASGFWKKITPIVGQTVLNINNEETYVFKADAWTSQAYVAPAVDYSVPRLLFNGLLNSEVTTDQNITLSIPGLGGTPKFHITEIIMTNLGGTIAPLDDVRIYDGASRTGNYLFLIGNLALVTIINDGLSYISLSDGDIGKQTKTAVAAALKLSVGTINGAALSNWRIKIYGFAV